jgi:hypothetical protein
VSPLAFLAIPFFDAVAFGTLAAAGLFYRRKPQIHKRLMVLSTLSILTPAVVRIPLDFVQSVARGRMISSNTSALSLLAEPQLR